VTLSRRISKPYYVFRPGQAGRRLKLALGGGSRRVGVASLPCGLDIQFEPNEAIGSSISRTGIFELAVSEVICRLLDPGEIAVDIGANIGHMTALMAAHTGPTGRVLAFEPHPDIFRRLRRNVDCWQRSGQTADIDTYELALSDRTGTADLFIDADFEHNMGTATLSNGTQASDSTTSVSVQVKPLDDVLDPDLSVGVLKVDVEGHESAVLSGAHQLLGSGRVRDILFEELHPLPTPTTEVLSRHGYEIFAIQQRFLGVSLVEPSSERAGPVWDAPTLLATRDRRRADQRLRRRGWLALRRPVSAASRSPSG
jgi:FkbM family methyltransferase